MIQVAAPEAGLYVECRHDLTEWQDHSNSFKYLGTGRLIHRSRFGGNTYTLKNRHLSPTIRGKQQIKAARKAKRTN
jgi:hypothetical protein